MLGSSGRGGVEGGGIFQFDLATQEALRSLGERAPDSPGLLEQSADSGRATAHHGRRLIYCHLGRRFVLPSSRSGPRFWEQKFPNFQPARPMLLTALRNGEDKLDREAIVEVWADVLRVCEDRKIQTKGDRRRRRAGARTAG